jgi:hypothetical protein
MAKANLGLATTSRRAAFAESVAVSAEAFSASLLRVHTWPQATLLLHLQAAASQHGQ